MLRPFFTRLSRLALLLFGGLTVTAAGQEAWTRVELPGGHPEVFSLVVDAS